MRSLDLLKGAWQSHFSEGMMNRTSIKILIALLVIGVEAWGQALPTRLAGTWVKVHAQKEDHLYAKGENWQLSVTFGADGRFVWTSLRTLDAGNTEVIDESLAGTYFVDGGRIIYAFENPSESARSRLAEWFAYWPNRKVGQHTCSFRDDRLVLGNAGKKLWIHFEHQTDVLQDPFGGVRVSAREVPVELEERAQASDIASFSCTVKNEAGLPVAGAIVRIHSSHSMARGNSSRPRVITDVAGRAEIRGLVPEDVYLSVWSEAYKPRRIWVPHDAQDFQIVMRNQEEDSIYEVSVIDDDGQPVPNAQVTLHRRLYEHPISVESRTTNAEGVVEFRFAPSSAGGYGILSCEIDAYDRAFSGVNDSADCEIRLVMHKSATHRTGKVIDPDGSPVKGAKFYMTVMRQRTSAQWLNDLSFPDYSEIMLVAESDELGEYSLGSLSPLDFVQLLVWAPGFVPKGIEFSEKTDKGFTISLEHFSFFPLRLTAQEDTRIPADKLPLHHSLSADQPFYRVGRWNIRDESYYKLAEVAPVNDGDHFNVIVRLRKPMSGSLLRIVKTEPDRQLVFVFNSEDRCGEDIRCAPAEPYDNFKGFRIMGAFSREEADSIAEEINVRIRQRDRNPR